MTCPNCIEGTELPGDPKGELLADFQGAYFTPAPATSTDLSIAVVLFTDAFGLPLKNCKIIADTIAERVGCDVWIPDYFAGKPVIPVDLMEAPERADEKLSVLGWVRFFFVGFVPYVPAMIKQRPSVVDARAESFFATLKQKKSYKKIGVVGYCYGGAMAIRLASKDLFSSAVVCHAAPFSLEEVRRMKVPSSWVIPEVDLFVPHRKRTESEAVFAAKKGTEDALDYEFKDYPGTQHGFASRPNLQYPEIVEAYEKALNQTVAWFKKTLMECDGQ